MLLCRRQFLWAKWHCYILSLRVVPLRRRFLLFSGMLLLLLALLYMRYSITSNGGVNIFSASTAKNLRIPFDGIRRFYNDNNDNNNSNRKTNDSFNRIDGRTIPEELSNAINGGKNNVEEGRLPGSTFNNAHFPKAILHRRRPWPVQDLDPLNKQNDGQTLQSRKDNFVGDTANSDDGPKDGDSPRKPKKYLIYLCDEKRNCYGFADRQRGIVSTYLMAELTNRTFGLIMTVPAPLEDYYVPNLVNWIIDKDLLKGKSSTELWMLGKHQRIDLGNMDFNEHYPEDVVYVRTNRDALHMRLDRNVLWKDNFPLWAQGDWKQQFALGWLRLMMPSPLLRQEINTILLRIAKTMLQEYIIHQELEKSPCYDLCNFIVPNKNMHNVSKIGPPLDRCFDRVTNSLSQVPPEYEIKGEDLYSITDSHPFRVSDSTQAKVIPSERARFLCLFSSGVKPRPLPSEIKISQNYDFVDLDLVCVHIRLGHNPSMPQEKVVRNNIEETDAVWNFLKPYVRSGRHVFLASDSEDVRILGKSKFGRRMHVSEAPVVHIDKVGPSNGENFGSLGLQLALTEQLMLMTSCRTLVVSVSGFSQRAAFIRRSLVNVDGLFLFKDGAVVPWPLSY